MRVKDVEVECEIDEDPAIFEGSEGYVQNLISKIQQQYKNPETVHIKITRRQKPDGIDKNGNLIKNKNESYGQIIRKEYYTIKNTPRPVSKSSSISSFVDTSNIPYIDEDSSDSRNNSVRNSRCIEVDTKTQIMPNYVVEKHVIYNQSDENYERHNIRGQITGIKGVKEFIQGFGRAINIDELNTKYFNNKDININVEQSDSEYEDQSNDIKIKGPEVKIKAPKIKGEIKKTTKEKNEDVKTPDSDYKIEIKSPKTSKKDNGSEIKIEVEVPKGDLKKKKNAADYDIIYDIDEHDPKYKSIKRSSKKDALLFCFTE